MSHAHTSYLSNLVEKYLGEITSIFLNILGILMGFGFCILALITPIEYQFAKVMLIIIGLQCSYTFGKWVQENFG